MLEKSEQLAIHSRMWRTLALISTGPLARMGLKSLAVQIAAVVFGLGQAIILARALGATDYGVFATAAGVSAILAAVAVGGFDQYSVRELSRLRVDGDFPTAQTFIRFGTRSALFASVLAGCGLAGIGAYAGADTEWRTTFILAGATTPLSTMLLLRAGQLRGLGAVVIAQVPVAIVRPGMMILVLAALWLAGASMAAPSGMATWLLASVVSVALASVSLYKRAANLDVSTPAQPLTRKWLLDVSPFFGSTVVVIVFGQVNTLMLAALAGPESAGLYQPIAYLSPVLTLPITALSMPLAPRIVELWRSGDESSLRRITWMYTAATFAGTCLIGVAVLLFGSYALGVFGSEFITVAPAIRWVVLATAIFAAVGPSEILCSMRDAQHVVLGGSIFSLTVSITLAALLIPTMKVEGAAIALAAGLVAGRSSMLLYTINRLAIDSSLVGAVRFWLSREDGSSDTRYH